MCGDGISGIFGGGCADEAVIIFAFCAAKCALEASILLSCVCGSAPIAAAETVSFCFSSCFCGSVVGLSCVSEIMIGCVGGVLCVLTDISECGVRKSVGFCERIDCADAELYVERERRDGDSV